MMGSHQMPFMWLALLVVVSSPGCTKIITEASSGHDSDETTGNMTGSSSSSGSDATTSDPSTSAGSTEAGTATSSTADTTSVTGSPATTTSGTIETSTTDVETTTGIERCPDPEIPGIPFTPECEYDFSGIDQLYCGGSCSPVPPPNCQKEDADLLCKLRLRSETAYAESYQELDVIDAPGFCCFGVEGPDAVSVGPFPMWGVPNVMCLDPVSILNHGGPAVQNVVCAD
ncbi:MAG: hypothetical protein H6729_00040 [Deltaproteobacteria bacterium]|nr:hypothetical protein [Deltaproteobacteria bacterium]